ncbi:hypothetical protein PWO56_08030 [Aeromonas hydrophila]|nr:MULTISPECIES: hypothetical protein [Aeromonas]WEA31745.1 hypothetical protein PWO56_08030 [Aeromonas hydrophila]
MMRLTSIALLLFAGAAVAGKERNLDFYNIKEPQLIELFARQQGAPGQSIRDFYKLPTQIDYEINLEIVVW